MEDVALKQKYQRKTEIEAILSNPEMYINSIEPCVIPEWCYSDDEKRMVKKEITYIPALFQLFDEVLINCRDHAIRCLGDSSVEQVDYIHVSITDDGIISFSNDGQSIDVAKYPGNDTVYIPEMIFAHLRTSTNYDKSEKKIVGGKHGLGVKLVNIWSKKMQIHVADKSRGLTYTQTFRENMSIIEAPIIRKKKVDESIMKISFLPDYARFGIDGIDNEVRSLFERRVLDLSAITDGIQIKYNKKSIRKKTFKDYSQLYGNVKAISVNKHWKIAIVPAESFEHISFVNGLQTRDGGTHLDFAVNKIIDSVRNVIEKEKKIKVRSQTIKEQLLVILSCNVINPSFHSQVKSKLTSSHTNFFPLTLDEDFTNRVCKMVIKKACSLTSIQATERDNRENRRLSKETDGSKRTTIQGIPALEDANFAGGRHSNKCLLIICEGLSAKTGILSGLSSSDRNTIGVYPIRGKLPNIRNVSKTTILNNRIIMELKKILGLKSDMDYTERRARDLRYGKIVFMTDQDLDGQHIKALALNLFHCLWPSLLKLDQFVGFVQTPIIKASRGKAAVCFYRQDEYKEWAKSSESGWSIKYYKGLGTSVGSEFKEYFTNLKIVYFKHTGEPCESSFKKVFEKTNSDLRKLWLYGYNESAKIDISQDVSYSDFINCELIHFSKYDCDRSIPFFVDGLKISQRKILFSAFKRNLTREIKVAQFSGYVAENTHYKHGEESLCKALINMAQNFVGSNNLNLFCPKGQFGSRVAGGDDSASPRYIFTQLDPVARLIYRKEDENVLEYAEDDGHLVEPKFYVPIVPMILINGSIGIGTGFSSEFISRNPKEVVDILIKNIKDETENYEYLKPWFRGFKGSVEKLTGGRILTTGLYTLSEKLLTITELPVGVWIQSYKELLEKFLEVGSITAYDNLSTDETVLFRVHLREDVPPAEIIKTFKLYSLFSENNMHAFNSQNKLVKYESIVDIFKEHRKVRLATYEKRKAYLLNSFREKIILLTNKIRYLELFIAEKFKLGRNKAETRAELESLGFEKIDDSYNYLLNLSFSMLQREEVDSLTNQLSRVKQEYEILKNTPIEIIWKRELLELRAAL